MPDYLPDTHVFLWYATALRPMKEETYRILRDPANQVFISAASIWEIAIKQGLGKLQPLDQEPEQIVDDSRFRLLDINAVHAKTAGLLPLLHRDPFDRMLVAQAQIEDLILITNDPKIEQYDVTTLRP
ncbi:MAG: type II toxin-antitoxin system VapC family toxin [Chloroflexota bacterium]|nr:type II toxin-antitoxin system VapC family toxin [Chloroflexota bacterium]MDE2961083.1 type II toxin-antitoxin system VapC family toxin [Chloroflexota bacterium]